MWYSSFIKFIKAKEKKGSLFSTDSHNFSFSVLIFLFLLRNENRPSRKKGKWRGNLSIFPAQIIAEQFQFEYFYNFSSNFHLVTPWNWYILGEKMSAKIKRKNDFSSYLMLRFILFSKRVVEKGSFGRRRKIFLVLLEENFFCLIVRLKIEISKTGEIKIHLLCHNHKSSKKEFQPNNSGVPLFPALHFFFHFLTDAYFQ